MNHRSIGLLILFIVLSCPSWTQTVPRTTAAPIRDETAAVEESRLSLAISSEGYPVTPGDIYSLSFLTGREVVTTQVLVESDYTLNLGVFGKMNGDGKRFIDMKTQVQDVVQKAYPQSMPSLTIISVGFFQVIVKGEVPQTRFVTGWGMTRLSMILADTIAPYSSVRNVQVIAKDGRIRRYDMFKAQRSGILDQDPYVRAGDTVVIARKDREIEIRGEVNSPGHYELLPTENIESVILYGRGFTHLADLSRIRIERSSLEGFRSYHADLTSAVTRFILRDGDIVTVPSKLANQQLVFIEGSLGADSAFIPEDERTLTIDGHNRVTHPFYEGDTLYDALIAIRDVISPSADLSNTIVIRKGTPDPIIVNTQLLLYEYDPARDLVLKPFDRIIIPISAFLDTETKQRIQEALRKAKQIQ